MPEVLVSNPGCNYGTLPKNSSTLFLIEDTSELEC